jgi:hypothetical protein
MSGLCDITVVIVVPKNAEVTDTTCGTLMALGADMRIMIVLAISLAGCHGASRSLDGGRKGAIDLGNATSLCTTAACAASPCTADCIYAAMIGSCSGAAPSEISSSKIVACPNRCGLRNFDGDDTSGQAQSGYCWQFDRNATGCVIPSCGFSSPQCTLVDDYFDTGGASMCAEGWTCTDGATVPEGDASAFCPDLSVVD